MITHSRLLEVLRYHPRTGFFTWRSCPSPKIKAGTRAGSVHPQGYRRISVDGHHYAAHRLAWFYVRGSWPPFDLDHKNTVKDDNRLSNLRSATLAENNQNRIRPNTGSASGLLGVSPDARKGKWRAQIWVNGSSKSLGRFDKKEDAHRAYLEAKKALHPFFKSGDSA